MPTIAVWTPTGNGLTAYSTDLNGHHMTVWERSISDWLVLVGGPPHKGLTDYPVLGSHVHKTPSGAQREAERLARRCSPLDVRFEDHTLDGYAARFAVFP